MQHCHAYLVTLLDGLLSLARLARGASELHVADVFVDAVLSTILADLQTMNDELRMASPPLRRRTE
jgi:hypothetical protein